jgi:V8-like Glu-specific endopeptidase
VIQYLADTLVGSSGSPVFNESAEIIAIHHSGGWLYEPSTSLAYFRNEGIRIAAILNDIRASLSPYPLD